MSPWLLFIIIFLPSFSITVRGSYTQLVRRWKTNTTWIIGSCSATIKKEQKIVSGLCEAMQTCMLSTPFYRFGMVCNCCLLNNEFLRIGDSGVDTHTLVSICAAECFIRIETATNLWTQGMKSKIRKFFMIYTLLNASCVGHCNKVKTQSCAWMSAVRRSPFARTE